MPTKIEWAEETWNPITGCTPISEGCKNCYAKRMATRLRGRCGYPENEPFQVIKHNDEAFIQPMKWAKPRRIFVCSMGDLFHPNVEQRWIEAIFAVMGLTYDVAQTRKQRHIYMILTKRPERMRDYINNLVSLNWESLRQRFYGISMFACDVYRKAVYDAHMNASISVATWIKDGMPGLWLGVTAENQTRADERIPILLQTPAAVRFVSVEPMLGPVDLSPYLCPVCQECDGSSSVPAYEGGRPCPRCLDDQGTDPMRVDWVICGGETGPSSRPMHPDWVKSLRDQCQAAGVPFFFKSWGEWMPSYQTGATFELSRLKTDEVVMSGPGHGVVMKKVGKKAAGRLLDGQVWEQYPEVRA